ncbi:Regulator of spindle pole body duplication [Pseudoloma neurophilia]|uniref:separase n=1 Tax=Pseudoloma neurophilia TaxID=146866 RepID=A0A0R0M8D6_9MICR|nr:Regulator of spindle pole body duplication [Pseudoloma neurophilia]
MQYTNDRPPTVKMFTTDCMTKETLRTVLNLKRNSPGFAEQIRIAYEFVIKHMNNPKILLGLWERADDCLKKKIFESLKILDFSNNIENLIMFDVIKLKMGDAIDKETILKKLNRTSEKFKLKIENILIKHNIVKKNRRFIQLNTYLLNHEQISHDKVYKEIKPNILILKEKEIIPEYLMKSQDFTRRNTTDRIKKSNDTFSIQIDQKTKNFKIYPTDNKIQQILNFLKDGNYHKLIRYLKKMLSNTNDNKEYTLFQEIYSLIQRIAQIPSPTPQIFYFTDDWKSDFILRYKLFDTFDHKIRDFKNSELDFKFFREKISSNSPVYLFYKRDHLFHILDISTNMTFNTGIDIDEKIYQLNILLMKSRETITRKVTKNHEIKKWWQDRYSLDFELKNLLQFNIDYKFPSEKILICLDDNLTDFPFENTKSLRDKSVIRLTCSEHFLDENIIKFDKINIVTGVNVARTEKRVNEFLKKYTIKKNTDIIAYFGHGNGQNLLKNCEYSIYMIFGCSSVRIINIEGFKRIGYPLELLQNKNVKIIIGCLWDVTDTDIDSFGLKFIEKLSSGSEFKEALTAAKDTLRLKYLNGASIVCYSKMLL